MKQAISGPNPPIPWLKGKVGRLASPKICPYNGNQIAQEIKYAKAAKVINCFNDFCLLFDFLSYNLS